MKSNINNSSFNKVCLSLLAVFGMHLNIAAQSSFINGDFEDNTSVDCGFNYTDANFNMAINNVIAFGSIINPSGSGETDIMTTDCYVEPQNGDWCLGLATAGSEAGDAIAIELSEPLTPGTEYELIFFTYGNTTFSDIIADLFIGESMSSTELGTEIHQVTPVNSTWTETNVVFTAAQASTFITVWSEIDEFAWNQIDNFFLSTFVANEDIVSEQLSLKASPNPTNSEITIDFGKQIPSGILSLTDLAGKIIYTQNITNLSQVHINLYELPSGIYFLKLIADTKSEVLKLVKE